MAEKYVLIQSEVDIVVTKGLGVKEGGAEDHTDKNVRLENRLRIAPVWQNGSVKIKKGKFPYPAEIVNWPTVKALAKDKVLTVGEECDYTGNPIEKVIRRPRMVERVIEEPNDSEPSSDLSDLVK